MIPTVAHPLLAEWKATLTPREIELHALAEVKLKAVNSGKDDSGSYFPDKCRAFRTWLKEKEKKDGNRN